MDEIARPQLGRADDGYSPPVNGRGTTFTRPCELGETEYFRRTALPVDSTPSPRFANTIA